MSFIDSITPKDTEEVKPGLFIQKKLGTYRQIYPAAWNGKVNWVNFFWGGKPWKSLFFFALILFLAWSYINDVGEYRNFYIEIQNNPVEYCTQVFADHIQEDGEQILDPPTLSGYS